MNIGQKKYDLEERTAKFGENIIKFCRLLPHNSINHPLTAQLIRSGTSVGANYSEADDAESGKDFVHKIGICRKESRETKHWLRMIATANDDYAEMARSLWREAKELNLIFNTISRKIKSNNSK